MTIRAEADAPVQVAIAVFQEDGIVLDTGLLDGDFIGKTLIQDDTDRTGDIALTVTEVATAPGYYIVEFTPDGDGLWTWYVTTPGECVLTEQVQVGQLGSEASISTRLMEIWQILGLDPDAPLCVSKVQQEAGTIVLSQTEIGKKVKVQRQV